MQGLGVSSQNNGLMFGGSKSPPPRRHPPNIGEWYALHAPCESSPRIEPPRAAAFSRSFYDDNSGAPRRVAAPLSAMATAPTAPRCDPKKNTPPTTNASFYSDAPQSPAGAPRCVSPKSVPLALSPSSPATLSRSHPPSSCPLAALSPTAIVPSPKRASSGTASPLATAARHHGTAGDVRWSLPLAQRDQPESPDALLLERQRATKLFQWVKRRAGKADGIERAAILMGPPGSGKTSAARVFLRAAGFQVVEFGPGSLSTECSLADQVRRVIKRKPLPGTRPPAVLIDDFDGLCAIDRDAETCLRRDREGKGDGRRARVGNLVAVIAEAKASSPPIIICSNDMGSAEVRLVREVCYEAWLDAVPRARLARLAKTTALRHNCTLDEVDAGKLADVACGDIRRLLNGLDMWLRVHRNNSDSALARPLVTRPVAVDTRSDLFPTNFGAVEVLLTARSRADNRPIDCASAVALYRADPLLRRAMVHHNYVHTVAEVVASDADALDRISRIADNFAAADAMDYGLGVSGTSVADATGGSTPWRAGSHAGGSVGWNHGGNAATLILWSWSVAALAPRPASLGAPDVAFCRPTVNDHRQYADDRDRLVRTAAVIQPVVSAVGAREPLALDFDLARATFLRFVATTYTKAEATERKAIIDRMVWAGVTPQDIARLVSWPRMGRAAPPQKGSMAPPSASGAALRSRHLDLTNDLQGRYQACVVMGHGGASAMVMAGASKTIISPSSSSSSATKASRATMLDLGQDAASIRNGKRKRSPADVVVGGSLSEQQSPTSSSLRSFLFDDGTTLPVAPLKPVACYQGGRAANVPRYHTSSIPHKTPHRGSSSSSSSSSLPATPARPFGPPTPSTSFRPSSPYHANYGPTSGSRRGARRGRGRR